MAVLVLRQRLKLTRQLKSHGAQTCTHPLNLSISSSNLATAHHIESLFNLANAVDIKSKLPRKEVKKLMRTDVMQGIPSLPKRISPM